MTTFSSSDCTPYWDEADWLIPLYILERWCQGDEVCMQAKLQAMLSACERGEVNFRRSDGKTFDDPLHELFRRGKLLIERNSFNQWCIKLEGKSPLTGHSPSTANPTPPTPSWAHESLVHVPGTPFISKDLQSQIKAQTDPLIVSPDEGQLLDGPEALSDVENLSETELRKLGVPSDEIIDAFIVFINAGENRKWWEKRIAGAKRNKPLLKARIKAGKSSKGEQRNQSWWDPVLIASYLIQGNHMPPKKVVRILDESFPDFARDSHLLMP